jgi:sugar lactone lactonase YvrE
MRPISRIGLFFFFIVWLNSLGFAESGIITTYVGPGMPVDGGLAVDQAIDRPTSVVADGAGGFYVASEKQNRVYRVSVDGKLSLVAGNGTEGFTGDGGPAAAARLDFPRGLAVDTIGNLFIADTVNNRIRKVTPAGVISTVAGNGTHGFGGDGGPATSAQLDYPRGVAVDAAGNLFIADTGGNRIRKVTPAGVISTVAGDGTFGFRGDGGAATSAQLRNPFSVEADAAGNLFIADYNNNRIRKVTPVGMISTVGGGGTFGSGDGGPATSAQLSSPASVAVDAAGNLLIADSENHCIRKVTPAGVISTMAGIYGTWGYGGDGDPANSAQLNSPQGIAVDATGNVFIADSENNRVRKVTPAGVISTVAGNGTFGFSGDGGPATSALLSSPASVVADTAGNLLVADNRNNRIRKVTPAGVISTVAGNGIYGFSGDGGPATSAQFSEPVSVVVDTAGNLFVADPGNNRIRKVTKAGVMSTVAGNGIEGFSGDGGTATSAQLYSPRGSAVDAAGNLFIADYGNNRIRKVTPAGVISTVAGTDTQGFSGDGGPATSAELYYPMGIAVDAAGDLFIADYGNNRIRKVTTAGVISTVAGSDTRGFSGDGGPATSAQLADPWSVATDTAGNLFIADTSNHRIRKVAGGPSVSTDLNLSAGGAATSITVGEGEAVQAGYASLTIQSGNAPYGTAVFSFKQNGVTVSEAGVPASPPTTSARIFIDHRSAVPAVPSRSDAGSVDTNTGVAIVNRGSDTANVTYLLRNVLGATLSSGHGTIAAGTHIAKFIDQLKDVASDFSLPLNFQSSTRFGSLEISSDQPLSILALRMTTNQRNEALFTTTPTANLTQSLSDGPIYFPQFADGAGYTTALVLLNTSSRIETGIFQILDEMGSPLVVNQVGGTADSSFKYSIPSGGAFRFQTDGFPATTKVGWVQLTPDGGTSTPVGAGVFGYNPGNVLVTESGIPAAASTTHARVYVDLSGGHNTGLAIANLAENSASISIKAFRSDGTTGTGASQGPLQLPGNGHSAKFAGEFVSGLPTEFTGVLDIRSATPFAALTMRSLSNERGDFLLTTFPIADMNRAAPSPIVFPQIADGGGYVTQFILLSPGGASSAKLSFYGETGAPLAVGKQ